METKSAAAFLICAGMSLGAGWVASGQAAVEGQSFVLLYPGFSQRLFGVTSSFAQPGGYLGGIAVLQNGDVVAAECMFSGARLHRFSATETVPGTTLHAETLLGSGAGCGIVVHPDGFLYSNRDAGLRNPGVVKIDPATGQTVALLGEPGNALGIAVDPKTNHIVYAGRDCRPRSGTSAPSVCPIYDLDPVTGQTVIRAEFDVDEVGYIGGLYFDPTGEFIFLNNRFPSSTLTILERDGGVVQHVSMPFGVDSTGVAFHTDGFVVTNNTDGSMTLFRFGDPADDDQDDDERYEEEPVRELFAFGGFRGDLLQVGPDGCLYVTQAGTRYDDFTETMENSIVRICASTGRFVPPPGVELSEPPAVDLRIAAFGPPAVAAGGTMTYTFVVTNDGGSAATQVVLTHQVPERATLVSRSAPAGWTCTVSSGNRATMTCSRTAMAAGEQARFDVTVAVDCLSSPQPALQVSAAVSSATPDSNLTNNTASLTPAVTVAPIVIHDITVQPLSVWPPNHRTVEAMVDYEVSGGCAPITTRLSVRSNEPDEKGPQVVDGKTVRVEAWRRGNGDGRTYTVTITATDGVNTTRAEVAIVVPHDMGNNKGNPISGKR